MNVVRLPIAQRPAEDEQVADKREVMRDIRGDLEDRVDMVEQQISLENARFEQLILRLKTEQSNKLEYLRAQLRLTNKLLEFMDWQQNVCVTLAARIAAAEEAEIEIWKSLRTGVGVAGAS